MIDRAVFTKIALGLVGIILLILLLLALLPIAISSSSPQNTTLSSFTTRFSFSVFSPFRSLHSQDISISHDAPIKVQIRGFFSKTVTITPLQLPLIPGTNYEIQVKYKDWGSQHTYVYHFKTKPTDFNQIHESVGP
jgi:hypothetical protein